MDDCNLRQRKIRCNYETNAFEIARLKVIKNEIFYRKLQKVKCIKTKFAKFNQRTDTLQYAYSSLAVISIKEIIHVVTKGP